MPVCKGFLTGVLILLYYLYDSIIVTYSCFHYETFIVTSNINGGTKGFVAFYEPTEVGGGVL